MTSEEPIDDSKKSDENKLLEPPDNKNNDKAERDRRKRSSELMKLVYEIPDDITTIENNNMLKENPPMTILEITEQNGCETELESARECDSDYVKDLESSPDLGNKVVYDYLPLDTKIKCADEYIEVIDRSTPDDCSDEDLQELKKILAKKPKVLERYLRECASTDELSMVHNITSSGPLSPRPHHEARSTSVTSDLIQLWLSSSPVKVSDNGYHEAVARAGDDYDDLYVHLKDTLLLR